ncbi:MAG: hypothetical protein EB060_11735, partial [Proteobacteria bacterium]|nr:hypothetical protein [Pseudomonadota bacterium]
PLNPLRAQDSPSNCGLDPWSFHVAGSTVYINLEGLNPNDFTIEAVPVNASTPPYGIRIQNGSSGVWIDELRFDGWGAGTQGLTLGDGNQANESGVVNEAGGTAAQAEHVAYISNCESYYNGAHAFSQQPSGIGGTHIVEGCLAGLGYNAPNGETTFNTYAGDGQQEAVFRRCFVRFGLLPQNIGTGNRRVTKGSITTNAGFFGHTAGNVNQPVGIYLNIDCGTMDERSSFDRATACQDYFGFDESSTSIFRTTDNAVPTSIRAFVIGYKSSRVRTETDSPLIGCQRMIFINSSFYMRRAWPIGSSITFAFRSFHSLCINCVFELEDEQGDRCALFQALDNVPSAMTRLLNCLLIFRGHAVNAASEDKFQIHGPNGNDKVRLANTIIISKDRLLNTVSGKQVSLCRASDVSLGGPANSTNTLRNVAIAGCFVASAGSWVGFDAAPGLVNLETANNTYPDPAVFVLGDTEARRMQSGGAYTLDPQSPLAGAGSSNPFSDKSDMLPAPEYDFFGRRRPATPSIGPVDVIDLGSGGFGRSVNRSVVVG